MVGSNALNNDSARSKSLHAMHNLISGVYNVRSGLNFRRLMIRSYKWSSFCLGVLFGLNFGLVSALLSSACLSLSNLFNT